MPSLLKARLYTVSVWPRNCPTRSPVDRSHKSTNLSLPAGGTTNQWHHQTGELHSISQVQYTFYTKRILIVQESISFFVCVFMYGIAMKCAENITANNSDKVRYEYMDKFKVNYTMTNAKAPLHNLNVVRGSLLWEMQWHIQHNTVFGRKFNKLNIINYIRAG